MMLRQLCFHMLAFFYLQVVHVCLDMLKTEVSNTERDINDIFDDIILTEERLAEKGYKEGFVEGCQEGKDEGYRLGFAQGLLLGEELADIYGLIVAVQQQNNHTEKVKRCMEHLKSLIEAFPKENKPDVDIIGSLEQIRNLNKKLRILLNLKNTKTDSEPPGSKNLSF